VMNAASFAQKALPPVKIEKDSEPIKAEATDKWVTVTAQAAGVDLPARDRAIAKALRTAVEQACGTFITSQSEARDFKGVYDRVLANSVGYVREHKPPRIWVKGGVTYAKVTARVSTQRFEQDWASIAHTVHREGNPRVIIAIADATWTDRWWTVPPSDETGIKADETTSLATVAQGKLEEFFLQKGIQLADKGQTERVNKRDLALAAAKNDTTKLAAVGARFKADVVIFGRVSAKYSTRIQIAERDAYKFVAALVTRAFRTDSGQLIASKTFGPVEVTSLQRGGGRELAVAKLAEESAPKVLASVVEAWRKQIYITRNIRLEISGMDYTAYKVFSQEAGALEGVKALRLREIIDEIANIDTEYEFGTQQLADALTQLKKTTLRITEFNPNRIKLKLTQQRKAPTSKPGANE